MAGTRDVAGRRYAAAVLEIAREERALDSWVTAIEGLESLTARPEFVAALQADGMTDERFQAIVRRVVPAATPVQLNLFRLLRRKARLGLGPDIASFFRELVDDERGIARAVVTSAVELEPDRRAALERRLAEQTGRQVTVETQVDPGILGGLIVRIGDRLVDGSTRGRLRALRSQLERAAL
ncbi:MAG: ATP synthase F1 subunit delta [Dehalococcoidia bacterium]